MKKIILSLAAVAALAGTGGAFAQADPRPGEEQTLLGLTFNGNRYVYREPDRGPYANYGHEGGWFGNNYRRNDRDRNDRDRDGVRDQRDTDRDGDGVRNGRDRYPDNARRN